MKTTEQINAEFDEMYKNPISNMWTEEFTNKIKSFIHTTRENDLKEIVAWGEQELDKYHFWSDKADEGTKSKLVYLSKEQMCLDFLTFLSYLTNNIT